MNWKLWLEGLAAAAIGGAATGATQYVQNGGKISGATGIAALTGAIVGVLGYLKTPATGSSSPASRPQN